MLRLVFGIIECILIKNLFKVVIKLKFKWIIIFVDVVDIKCCIYIGCYVYLFFNKDCDFKDFL